MEEGSIASRASTSTTGTSTTRRRNIFGSAVKKQYESSNAPNYDDSNRTAARRRTNSVASASNASTISSSVFDITGQVAVHERSSSPPKVIRSDIDTATTTSQDKKNRGRSVSNLSSPIINAAVTAINENPPSPFRDAPQSPLPIAIPSQQPSEEPSRNTSTSSEEKKTSSSPPQKMSLEKQLFHQLHRNEIKSPSIKEFKECWTFATMVQKHFKPKSSNKPDFDLIIDVAGGHGALAAVLLILTSAKRAVVIDPADVGSRGVELAWGDFYRGAGTGTGTCAGGKVLDYRHECLRTGLRDELHTAIFSSPQTKTQKININPRRILVVACHACQHLTDETLQIAREYGVHMAVMPCCQKDDTGGSWKAVSKNLGIGIGPLLDVLAAGKVMSWNSSSSDGGDVNSNGDGDGDGGDGGVTYQVRMKFMDEKITPQNRIILCKAVVDDDDSLTTTTEKSKAHERLERAYKKAHAKKGDGMSSSSSSSSSSSKSKKKTFAILKRESFCIKSVALGLAAGLLISNLSKRRR